jgi:hypothetical protein
VQIAVINPLSASQFAGFIFVEPLAKQGSVRRFLTVGPATENVNWGNQRNEREPICDFHFAFFILQFPICNSLLKLALAALVSGLRN